MTPRSIPDAIDDGFDFASHGFSARFCPRAGGNIHRFRHEATGQPLLREPKCWSDVTDLPEGYGIPVLFPPTRIRDGKFTFQGRSYELPISEEKTHNHLHGLAVNQPWTLLEKTSDSVTFLFHFTQEDPRFAGFPHEFLLQRQYLFCDAGLVHTMTVRNLSGETMPLGLGYHTAFFCSQETRCRFSTGDQMIEIGDRHLPTGRELPWPCQDPRTPFNPAGAPFNYHATTQPSTGLEFRGCELVYPTGTLQYRIDEKFAFWYTWDGKGDVNFLCLEPLSWNTNAPNDPRDPAITGLRSLEPGDHAIFTDYLLFQPHQRPLTT